jgi:hypothetical protein
MEDSWEGKEDDVANETVGRVYTFSHIGGGEMRGSI